jgi:hypothetical protein
MTQAQETEAQPESVPELSDEQMDQYFETQGESMEGKPEDEAKAEEVIESNDEEESKSSVDKPNEKDDRTVPLAALHQERQKRQEQDRKLSLLAERLEKIQEASVPKEPEIDVTENPVEYFQQENAKMKAELDRINQANQQTFAHQQQQAQVNQFKQAYASKAQEFSQQQPDFGDAYRHLVESRMSELQAVGYTSQEAAMIAQNDEAAFVSKAFQDGVNPAERVYQFAIARGYKQSKPEVDLETVEKGVKQKSVSSMKGAPTQNLTLESLAEMSDADFEANFDKLMRQS